MNVQKRADHSRSICRRADRSCVREDGVVLAISRRAAPCAGDGSITVERERSLYDLPDRYVFYPARYAFHKNHLYLLEGLVELGRRHRLILRAVFPA
jgi:hypothetical protein